LSPAGEPDQPDAGKYIQEWRRQSDGTWKLRRKILRSDSLPVRADSSARAEVSKPIGVDAPPVDARVAAQWPDAELPKSVNSRTNVAAARAGSEIREQRQSPGIFDVREMATVDFERLDLARTAVLIPGGILEQHGPYLPAYTDGYTHEYIARGVAERIVARPGWTVLMFPSIPLGEGGANQIGGRHVFPGTFHIHFPAMRAMYMDLASELGEAGFRWTFVIDNHGARGHRRAIAQASQFFCDTYGGVMVNLCDLKSASRPLELGLTAEEKAENGFDVHGGMSETSRVLVTRPDLVRQGYKAAKAFSGRDWLELTTRGDTPGWPGYFGSPRLATAARGEAILRRFVEDAAGHALGLLDGADLKTIPRTGPAVSAPRPDSDGREQHAKAILAQQRAWLARRGLE
jgi:creatinine amidohydrolase